MDKVLLCYETEHDTLMKLVYLSSLPKNGCSISVVNGRFDARLDDDPMLMLDEFGGVQGPVWVAWLGFADEKLIEALQPFGWKLELGQTS